MEINEVIKTQLEYRLANLNSLKNETTFAAAKEYYRGKINGIIETLEMLDITNVSINIFNK